MPNWSQNCSIVALLMVSPRKVIVTTATTLLNDRYTEATFPAPSHIPEEAQLFEVALYEDVW